MPPIRGKSSTSSRKARLSKLANTQTHRTKKLRKYYNPAARYVALQAVYKLARDPAYEQGFTIKEVIERAYEISADARHKLGNNATRVTEDYILFFRHYGYLREVGQSTDKDGEVSITFQAQDSLKDLVQLVENSISDSGLDPSEDGREVFVAISTQLRETVTPDNLREIAQMHRSSQAQQRLMRDKLVLEKQVEELKDRLSAGGRENGDASLVTVSEASTPTAPVVRPNPRWLGELANDSFYMDDVEPEVQHSTTTPMRPLVQSSSGSGAYPSPTSLPRPAIGGPSLHHPETPSRGNRGMRTPPSSPGGHDDDDDDDTMMVDGYLTNPSTSFQADTSNPRQPSPSSNFNRVRSRADRRLAALTILRRRNERITRAYQAARKELVKQRVETRKEREAGMIKNGEIASLKEMYNTLLGHLKPLAPLIGLPFLS